MKFRVLEVIDKNGSKRYRVQRRWFWLFWVTTTTAIESCVYVHEYLTIDEAKAKIQELNHKSNSRKIVQKNIVCGGDVVGGDLYQVSKDNK